ncbi:acyltransferase family protein [Uliginosibacterium gangwonense]|uniref:acyltransferase family protein n=1 Tax=Uliginosibacterium gangwonense TaxID=392736 RepID=UPI00039FBA00|nr:acyltransferase family protein [Uliginosibacterium gangwonense]
MRPELSRLSIIDGLKVLASQIIVLHHLSSYGPLADALGRLVPECSRWLFAYGRMAVQVFLVTGGFLAARSLAPGGVLNQAAPLELIWHRYARLAVPLIVAVAGGVVCAGLARCFLQDDFIPAAPGVLQILAHVFLLQDVLHLPALSAGVWYVAIDFQLYSLTIFLFWAARRLGRTSHWVRFLGLASVAMLAVLSLFIFNRDADWDIVAPYHFAAYSFGLICYWLTREQRLPCFWLGVGMLAVVGALYIDFRERIALALVCAVCMGGHVRTGMFATMLKWGRLKQLSRESYSLFLVHFPICMLANAVYAQVAQSLSVSWAWLFMGAAWWASMSVARYFHVRVDQRAELILQRVLASLRSASAMHWRFWANI